eukprot:763301-Hanusia_phi.AAC.7
MARGLVIRGPRCRQCRQLLSGKIRVWNPEVPTTKYPRQELKFTDFSSRGCDMVGLALLR